LTIIIKYISLSINVMVFRHFFIKHPGHNIITEMIYCYSDYTSQLETGNLTSRLDIQIDK
jgi:hypothetical protein